MYSPTISIRITDADTRGRGAEIEGRPDQNTHREKLRQEGQHLSTECLLFHSPLHWTWSLTSWQQFWTDQFYIHNKHLCHLKVDLHVLLWKTYRTRRPDSHNNNCIPPRLLPLARPSLIKLQSSLLTSSQCYIATFHLSLHQNFISRLGQIEMTGWCHVSHVAGDPG